MKGVIGRNGFYYRLFRRKSDGKAIIEVFRDSELAGRIEVAENNRINIESTDVEALVAGYIDKLYPSKSMTTTSLRATYETYRLQIMLNGVDREGNLRIPSAYYYSVSNRIYPYFHSEWCEEPDPFAGIYSIGEKLISEVLEYVDELWVKKKPIPSFYALESKFGRGKRMELIHIFRYCYLNGGFDGDFYAALLAPTQYPTEASGICRDLSDTDFMLM